MIYKVALAQPDISVHLPSQPYPIASKAGFLDTDVVAKELGLDDEAKENFCRELAQHGLVKDGSLAECSDEEKAAVEQERDAAANQRSNLEKVPNIDGRLAERMRDAAKVVSLTQLAELTPSTIHRLQKACGHSAQFWARASLDARVILKGGAVPVPEEGAPEEEQDRVPVIGAGGIPKMGQETDEEETDE